MPITAAVFAHRHAGDDRDHSRCPASGRRTRSCTPWTSTGAWRCTSSRLLSCVHHRAVYDPPVRADVPFRDARSRFVGARARCGAGDDPAVDSAGGLTLVGGFVVFAGVGEALGFPGGFGEFVFFEEPEEFKFAWDIAILSTVAAVRGMVVGWYFWANGAEPARRAGETFRPVYLLLLQPLLHRRRLPVGDQPHRARRWDGSSPGSTATS